jgi:hypothetical protein
MCRVVDRKVTVRPLAGTRRRGATEEEDRRLAEDLLADPKELAARARAWADSPGEQPANTRMEPTRR